MAFENEDQAIEALTNASAQDAGESQPTPTPAADDQQAPDSGQPRIDPAQLELPDDARSYLEQREREMQADYTRKTQEVAAQRREAEQAMEFLQTLNSDPNFAYQVSQTLTQALQEQGYTLEDASALAQASQGFADDDQFVDPYMAKIQELENWQAQQEQRFAEQQATNYIEQGVSAIRQANPEYGDDDVKDILTMAFAFNGDVVAAADAYKSVTQRVTEGYLAQKSGVPSGLNQPSSAGHAEIPPEGFKDLNDPRLEQAAQRMLADSGAQW